VAYAAMLPRLPIPRGDAFPGELERNHHVAEALAAQVPYPDRRGAWIVETQDLRRGLWRILRRLDDEVAGGNQLLPAETVLRVEVQPSRVDRALEGATVTVAEACGGRDGERGHGEYVKDC